MSKVDPINVQIAMLKKGIKRSHLKRRFRVKTSAISMALHGHRPTLLGKIHRFVKSYQPRISRP